MARSLAQMLLADQGGGSGDVLTQVQRGVSTGIQIATIEEQVDQQRAATATQKIQAETAKLNFLQKGFNSIVTATSDAAAKRKAKLFQNAAQAAGITIAEDFTIDAAEQREKTQVLNKGLAEILSNPNITPEQRSAILGETLNMISQNGTFNDAFTAARSLAQLQSQQQARQETREAQAQTRLSTNLVKAQEDFEKRVKNERQRLEGVSTVKSLLETGGPISQSVAQFQIARLAQGAGVLTDRDVQRLGGSRALQNRVESFVNTILEGKPLTPSDTAELLDIVNLFDTRLNEQLQEKAQQFAEGRAKALKQPVGEVLDVLNVGVAAAVPEGAPDLAGQQPQQPLDVEGFIEQRNLSPEQAQQFRQAVGQQQPQVAEQPAAPTGPIPAQPPELLGR